MADQQLGMTAEDPFRSECLSVGYDDMFTAREKVKNSLDLLLRLVNELRLFVKQWVPCTDEMINQMKKSITKGKEWK